jgi:hypothetical protein
MAKGRTISPVGEARLVAKLRTIPVPSTVGPRVVRPKHPGRIWIRLTASQSFASGKRWKFEWEEIYLDASDDVQAIPNGMTGTFDDSTFAINEADLSGVGCGPLPNGTVVEARLETRSDGSTRAVFHMRQRETISGKITSDASGKAKYNGKSFLDTSSDVSGSGDLAESDFGDLSSTEDCLVLVPPELGSSTTGHDVTNANNTAKFSLYFSGRVVRINSDGKKVVHANHFWVGQAEPA